MTEVDFTARERARLLAQHAESAPVSSREPRISEARAKYPAARVFWDDEIDDVMVDLSSARGA